MVEESLKAIDKMWNRETSRCWVEVDLGAIEHNAAATKKWAGVALMAVVKADGYGHGIVQVAKAVRPYVDFIGVANYEEAEKVDLALEGDKKIFLLSPALAEERERICRRGYIAAISSYEEAAAYHLEAVQQGRRQVAHLVLDTGMGRMGVVPSEAVAVLKKIQKLDGVRVEGVASHFPSADEDREFTAAQIKWFDRAITELEEGCSQQFAWRHCHNSAGILGYPIAPYNLVRPGLMLYGISPLPEEKVDLHPAMALKSRITLVRELEKGNSVSYGRTYVAEESMRVATVAIGYGDGYCRSFSNCGIEVLVRGKRCPLLGRVTMDQIVIDVSALNNRVQEGDEVVLFGAQGKEYIGVDELARQSGLIPWEILTGITRRVERFYLDPHAPTKKRGRPRKSALSG